MKLRCNFEIVNLEDEFCAVPVGEGSNSYHAVLQLNDVAAKMLGYIDKFETPEEIHGQLCRDFPEDDPKDIAQKFCDFLNLLEKEHLLLH